MAVDFDGTDDIITAAASTSFAPANISVAIWISYTSVSRYIISNFDSDFSWILQLTATDKLQAIILGAGGQVTGGEVALSTGVWHHVGFTWDSDRLKLYIDGALANNFDGANGDLTSKNNRVFISDRSSGDREYAGLSTDAGIWGVDIGLSGFQALYNSRMKHMPLQIYPSNLVSYWPLDDVANGVSGDGATFLDLSGNGHSGTGDDGANDSGLTGAAESYLTYPGSVIIPGVSEVVTGNVGALLNAGLVGGKLRQRLIT